MTDNLKQDPEILPPLTPGQEALETAKLAWGAAITRCALAHRAAVADLDKVTDFALREHVEEPEQAMGDDPRRDLRERLLARLDRRVLLLAEALQKHGLLRILDAAASADAIARGSAMASATASTNKNEAE
ncbi:MAG: hypothetical protein ACREFK_04765 [Stellaceae bacterium]